MLQKIGTALILKTLNKSHSSDNPVPIIHYIRKGSAKKCINIENVYFWECLKLERNSAERGPV
jgi:hypothetical protein